MSEDVGDTSNCPWSERETELLAITLELLQEHGYDRLSVEAVATKAKASKATMYRRWPSKADLVLAAFIEGTRSRSGKTLAPKLGEKERKTAPRYSHSLFAAQKECSPSWSSPCWPRPPTGRARRSLVASAISHGNAAATAPTTCRSRP